MITMSEKIKGVKSYSTTEFQEYIYHRNRAFMTFDYARIAKVQRKYGIEPQKESSDFWLYVAQTVIELEDAPKSARAEAMMILDELNALKK